MEFINPKSAPAVVGPYSVAARVTGGFLFLSGQIPLDPATGAIDGQDVASQTRRVLSNIEAALGECGYSKTDVFKAVVYMTDLSRFAEMNDIYAAFFGAHKPVRSTVQVAALPKGALVEIEVSAHK